MPSYLARTDLSREDLILTLRNQDGYLQDAISVRYTVVSWSGEAVSGRSLKATRRSTGEYYAPWRTSAKNGAYVVKWEIVESEFNREPTVIDENIFVVDPSDYVCSNGSLKESAIPPAGSGTFLSGSQLYRSDLPLFLKNSSGFPANAYAVFWTIVDRVGKQVAPRTPAVVASIGEYYAPWRVTVPSGDYRIVWEFMQNSDSPLESKSMPFSVICPTSPYNTVYHTTCFGSNTAFIDSCGCSRSGPAQPTQPCPQPPMPPYPPYPPGPCCSPCLGYEIPRTVHLVTGVLPLGGVFTNQSQYTIPRAIRRIAFYVTYSRGSAGGYPVVKLIWGDGVSETQETAVGCLPLSINNPTVTSSMLLQEMDGPTPTDDNPVSFIVEAKVPGGSKTVRLLAAERGVIASPGMIGITLTAATE